MKKIILISAIAILTSNLHADNTDTTQINIRATIISDLAVSTVKTMVLPDLVAPKTTLKNDANPSTSVLLKCNGAGDKEVIYSKFGKPKLASTTSGTCAQAVVTGQANYSFTIETKDPVMTVNNISITEFTCKGANKLDSSGRAKLYCGALITASKTEATASYLTQGSVTVTYD